MSNDTVMIRLQKDTNGRDFNLESEKTGVRQTKGIQPWTEGRCSFDRRWSAPVDLRSRPVNYN